MILIMSLQTVEPILIPLYFEGSDLDPLFFHKVFSLELPHASGMSKSVLPYSVLPYEKVRYKILNSLPNFGVDF